MKDFGPTCGAAKGNLLEAYARALLAAGKKIIAIETFDQLLQLDLPSAWKDRINKELDQMAEEFRASEEKSTKTKRVIGFPREPVTSG